MDKIQITNEAAERILSIAKKQNNPSLYLRLTVEGGGCSGFQYIFAFEDNDCGEDLVFLHKDAKVVIDSVSYTLLEGSIIDYVEDLSSAQFVIKNPNAMTKCGCGNSFGI